MHPNNCRVACDAESCKCSPTRQAMSAADAPDDLVERLTDEADLCINDGADDIAKLLMSAASRIVNLTERERRCPAMEEAESRALLRGLMGCADEMGLSYESSPAAVVDALQCLKRRHAQMMLSAEAQADEREGKLRAWIEVEGERSDTCTRSVLGKTCSYCKCGRITQATDSGAQS